MGLKKTLIMGMACLLSMPVFSGAREDIEARIQPVGQVQIAGDASSKMETDDVEAPVVAAAMSGEDVYKKHCVVCHAAGVAGAPISHNKANWAPRQEKGIDALLASAIKGVNAMPPKGTCMNCSDGELKAAIEYMLPK
tara:strand:+ start:764 stop:1177 length:414 start_codon:yes stop_codon:yes gene_type:complete